MSDNLRRALAEYRSALEAENTYAAMCAAEDLATAVEALDVSAASRDYTAEVEAIYAARHQIAEANDRIARIVCPLIAALVRAEFPDADHLLIDTTDQDLSGALVGCSVADADDDTISDGDWTDDEVPLPNGADSDLNLAWLLGCLADDNRGVWGTAEFYESPDDRRTGWSLNLDVLTQIGT